MTNSPRYRVRLPTGDDLYVAAPAGMDRNDAVLHISEHGAWEETGGVFIPARSIIYIHVLEHGVEAEGKGPRIP